MRHVGLVLGLLACVSACGEVAPGQADAAPGTADAARLDAAAGACTGLDQASCLARGDCHAGFEILDCDNVLGYCASYLACEDGAADCLGPATCERVEPTCAGPFVVSYTGSCYGACVRADQCGGCRDDKITFTQGGGCANDGSVEFCIPPALEHAVTALAPTARCAPGGGRAGCDPATELLCQLPTDEACQGGGGIALSDDAWATLCHLSMLPDVTQIVPTIFE